MKFANLVINNITESYRMDNVFANKGLNKNKINKYAKNVIIIMESVI